MSGEYYHLTNTEYNNYVGLLSGTVAVPNADKLDGFDSNDFAMASHSHNHNAMSNVQGGNTTERYHVFLNWYNAMSSANNPSATNPFITLLDLGGTIQHNTTGGLQGGQSGEYYHLTESERNTLVNGGDASSLHNHTTTYYTKTIADTRFLKVDGSNSMTGDLNMDGNLVTNMATPVNPNDGATKAYVDDWSPSTINHNDLLGLQGGSATERYHFTQSQHDDLVLGNDASTQHHHDSRYYTKALADARYLKASGGIMTGTLDMNNNALTGVNDAPSAQGDAVNKKYVDEKAVPSGVIVSRLTMATMPGWIYTGLIDSVGGYLYQKE